MYTAFSQVALDSYFIYYFDVKMYDLPKFCIVCSSLRPNAKVNP